MFCINWSAPLVTCSIVIVVSTLRLQWLSWVILIVIVYSCSICLILACWSLFRRLHAHEAEHAQNDHTHDCDTDIRSQNNKRQLEGFLIRAASQANSIVFNIEDRVVLPQEDVSQDPEVGIRTQFVNQKEAITVFAFYKV